MVSDARCVAERTVFALITGPVILDTQHRKRVRVIVGSKASLVTASSPTMRATRAAATGACGSRASSDLVYERRGRKRRRKGGPPPNGVAQRQHVSGAGTLRRIHSQEHLQHPSHVIRVCRAAGDGVPERQTVTGR